MDALPKTLIDALNSAMKENQTLTWRIHGMDDKVIMNLMWTPRIGAPKVRDSAARFGGRSLEHSMLGSRSFENSLTSLDDGYTTQRSESSMQTTASSVSSAKNYACKHDKNGQEKATVYRSLMTVCSVRIFT